jgi:L-2-hydroxyglutarate oxidase LhgO
LVETVDKEGERCLIAADSVVNCAGLYADLVAEMALGGAFPAHYRQYYCKGNYYAYSRKTLVSRLIYPVPEKNLKVCATRLSPRSLHTQRSRRPALLECSELCCFVFSVRRGWACM